MYSYREEGPEHLSMCKAYERQKTYRQMVGRSIDDDKHRIIGSSANVLAREASQS